MNLREWEKKMQSKAKSPTAKDAILQIQQHEKECTYRYKAIEQQLYSGSKKFQRIELMLWSMYPFIIGCLALSKFG